MTTMISVNGFFTNDQTSDKQDDDRYYGTVNSSTDELSVQMRAFLTVLNGETLDYSSPPYDGLSTDFQAFLASLDFTWVDPGDVDDAFADDVEGAASRTDYDNGLTDAVETTASLITIGVPEGEAPDGFVVNDLKFSDSAGNALNGDLATWDDPTDDTTDPVPLLTVDGELIYFWSFGSDFVIAATDANGDADDTDPVLIGEVVSVFHLIPASDNLSASVEVQSFKALDHPDTTKPDDTVNWGDVLNVSATGALSFDLSSLDPGAYLFANIASADAQTALMITGINPVIRDSTGRIDNSQSDKVNTSAAGGTTTGIADQHFDPGDIGVFTFITNDPGSGPLPVGGYVDIDDMAYDGLLDVKDAEIEITQIQAGGVQPTANIYFHAYEAGKLGEADDSAGRAYLDNDLADGPNTGAGIGDGTQDALNDDDPVNIVRVDIFNAGNLTDIADYVFHIGDSGTPAGGYTVTWSPDLEHDGNHIVLVEGVTTGNRVKIYSDDLSTTDDVETFNRFWIEGDVGVFDVGDIKTSEGATITAPVGSTILMDDDGPTVSVAAGSGSLTIDLDESIGSGGGFDAPEAGGGTSAIFDDITGITTTDGSVAFGSLRILNNALDGLFTPTADSGTDGPTTPDVDTDYELTLTKADGTAAGADGVETTWRVTEAASGGSSTIFLFLTTGGVIEGRANLDGNETDYASYETLALKIYLAEPESGDTPTDSADDDLIIEQWAPIADIPQDDETEGDEDGDTATEQDHKITLGIPPLAPPPEEPLAAEPGIGLKRTDTVTDSEGDSASDNDTYNLTDDITLEDDGVVVVVSADVDDGEIDAISVNLDETIGPDGAYDSGDDDPARYDNYNGTETESPDGTDPVNGNVDDTGYTVLFGAKPIGSLSTQAGDLQDLFVDDGTLDTEFVDYGTDGPGTVPETTSSRTDTLSFSLAAPVRTTLSVTDVADLPASFDQDDERQIWLVQTADNVVLGVTRGEDATFTTDGDGFTELASDNLTVFRFTINNATSPATATITYDQFAPVESSDATQHDEEDILKIYDDADGETTEADLKLRWTTVAYDGDDDFDSDYAEVDLITKMASVVSVDDDGPRIDVKDAADQSLTIQLDESEGDGTAALDGLEDPNQTAPESDDPGAGIGRVVVDNDDIVALFTNDTDGGTDGERSVDTDYALTLTKADGTAAGSDGVKTTWQVTEAPTGPGSSDIYLFLVGGVIEGRANLDGDETDYASYETLALKIYLENPSGGDAAKTVDDDLVIEQLVAIADASGNAGATAADHDNEIALAIAGETVDPDAGVAIKRTDTITDNDGDTASDSETYNFTGDVTLEDDGPGVNVTVDATPNISAIAANLDETIKPSAQDSPYDVYNLTLTVPETESDGVTANGDADDTGNTRPTYSTNPGAFGATTDPKDTGAIGLLQTTAGDIADLFLPGSDTPANELAAFVDLGTDGGGDLNGTDPGTDSRSDVLTFELAGPVKTTLTATATDVAGTPDDLLGWLATDREIWLVQIAEDVVVGVTRGAGTTFGTGNDGFTDLGTDNYVIFRMTLVDNDDPLKATIAYEQFAPIQHAGATLYDEEAPLYIDGGEDELKLRWTTNAIDGDSDTASDYEEVTLVPVFDNEAETQAPTVLSFDDDGFANLSPQLPTIQEDDLTGGNNYDGSDGTAYMAVTDIGAVILPDPKLTGIEPPITASLDGSDLQELIDANLTSQGETLSYEVRYFDNSTVSNESDDYWILYGFVDDTSDGSEDPVLYDAGADRIVFEWKVTRDAIATYTQKDQLDHPTVRNSSVDDIELEETVEVNPSSALRLYDADGDVIDFSTTSTLRGLFAYDVQDDNPLIAWDPDYNNGDGTFGAKSDIDDGLINFLEGDSGDSVTKSLKGYIGTDKKNPDGFDDDPANLHYTFWDDGDPTDDDGIKILSNGGITGLEWALNDDDDELYFFVNKDDNAGYTEGDGLGGDDDILYFSVKLNQTDGNLAVPSEGSYTATVEAEAPESFTLFGFEDLPQGHNLFGIVGEYEYSLLVMGSDPDYFEEGSKKEFLKDSSSQFVNVSAGSQFASDVIAVDNNHFDTPSDDLWIAFLNYADPNFIGAALEAKEANNALNVVQDSAYKDTSDPEPFIDSVSSAFLQTSRATAGEDAALRIYAFDLSDETVEGPTLLDVLDTEGGTPDPDGSTQMSIISVTVYSPLDFQVAGTTLADAVESATFDLDPSDISSGTRIVMATQQVANPVTGINADVWVEFVWNDTEGAWTAEVFGMEAGMTVEWTTGTSGGPGADNAPVEADASAFNVEYISGKWGIGFVGTSEANDQPDAKFQFAVQAEDFDSDFDISKTIEVLVDGTGTFDGETDDTGVGV